MKIDNKQALKAIAFVSKLSSGSVVPMYGNVRLVAVDGVATFTCTNGQTTLQARSECDGDIDTCVDAKRLSTFCKNATGPITINVKDEKLTGSSGRARTSLAIVNASGFPPLPDVSGDAIEVDGEKLKECIDLVSYAIGKNDSRPQANGLYIDKDNLVCTNGHIVGVAPIDTGLDTLLPGACLPSLVSMLDGACTIRSDEYSAIFECGDFTLSTKQIAAKYFNWQKIMPSTDKSFSFNRAEFLKALSSVQMTANAKTPRVCLELTGSLMNISCSDGVNDTSNEIDLSSTDGDLMIPYNINYLITTCSILQGDIVTVGYTKPDGATTFSDGSESRHVVMPQR